MKEHLKFIGLLAAITCLTISVVAGLIVFASAAKAPIPMLWYGVGTFFIGTGIFSCILLTMVAYGFDSQKPQVVARQNKRDFVAEKVAEAKKWADKKAKTPKTNKPKTAPKPKKDEPIRRESEDSDQQEKGPANIHVSNLSQDVTDSDLREEFAVFGTVKNVRLITDKETGDSKGYAFVEMENREDAQLAIDDINGQELKGQTVKVEFARPRNRRRNFKRRA